MPETLLGELSQSKFFDLIKPLLAGRKTGTLVIKGDENGEVFLEMGNIVHAKTAHSFGEEAFLDIMSWPTGKATFNPDAPPREKTIFIPTETLLLNWSYKKQEWEKIRRFVPSPNTIFRISVQSHPEDKNIKGDEWNVLAMTNGSRTVLEVAKALGWDEFKTSKVMAQLIETGSLERGEVRGAPSRKLLEKGFFQRVENELKKIIGPVAPFIIDDHLSEIGETRDSFPQDQALSLVEALSEDIPNEQKKKEFKRTVMEVLSLER
ncbi:MAG: DUF4388 domain-containing protein [Thermodesulfobacteriota bacterium]